jgi:hypothetical protein
VEFERIWTEKGPVDHGYAADYQRLANRLVEALVCRSARPPLHRLTHTTFRLCAPAPINRGAEISARAFRVAAAAAIHSGGNHVPRRGRCAGPFPGLAVAAIKGARDRLRHAPRLHPKENEQMETIDIFYQGHGLREIEHIEARPDHTIAVIKEILIEKHSFEGDTLIFLEDQESPLEDYIVIKELCGPPAPRCTCTGAGTLRSPLASPVRRSITGLRRE